MFSYTPLGWVLLIGSILALAGIVRSAIVPPYQRPTNVYPLRKSARAKPLEREDSPEPGLFAGAIFAVLMFGVVKWSWFGILPNLALFLGPPFSFGDRVTTALGISLLTGSVALAAFGMAEALQAIARSLAPTCSRELGLSHLSHDTRRST